MCVLLYCTKACACVDIKVRRRLSEDDSMTKL